MLLQKPYVEHNIGYGFDGVFIILRLNNSPRNYMWWNVPATSASVESVFPSFNLIFPPLEIKELVTLCNYVC